MNHREIAVAVSNDNQEVSVTETIDAIKNAGFKNVFIQWYNKDWNPSQEEQLKYVREQGLNVIFAHLGYQNINDLWLENENGENLVPRYINDLKICKENEDSYNRELAEKYSYEKLFKNRKKATHIIEDDTITDLVVHKEENIFTKIINKIKSIFKR